MCMHVHTCPHMKTHTHRDRHKQTTQRHKYYHFCFAVTFRLYWKYMTRLYGQFNHSVCLWISLTLKPRYFYSFSPLARLQHNEADSSVDAKQDIHILQEDDTKNVGFKYPEILRQTGTLPENQEKEMSHAVKKLVMPVSSHTSLELFPHCVTCELVVKAWTQEFTYLPSNLILTRTAYIWTPAN